MEMIMQTDTAKLRNTITSRRWVLGLAAALTLVPSLGFAQAPAKKPRVVASFSILGDMAKQVAGDLAEISTIVGPNADSHVYRATPQDAKTIRDADLVIVNGLGFDGFMPRLIKSSGTKARVVTATAGLQPLEKPKSGGHDHHGHSHGHSHDHGKQDPHAWQSLEAAKTYVANIRDGLMAVDAANAAAYRARAEAYLADIEKAKTEIVALLAPINRDNRLAITGHDSFRYLARDVNIRIEGAHGLSTETEPSAKDVARIIRIAKEKKARAVFLENVADPRIAERLAKETGAKLGGTLYSDALTDEKGAAPTYLALMRHNARVLAEALRD
jgi:zinc/manganese transport system substrate-binding protein